MENTTILGISIGTRQCGIALLRNGVLIDWRVKNYPGKWSQNKLFRIVKAIERMIQKHGVRKIRCKIPLHMKTYRIDALTASLEELALRMELQFCLTTIDQLKSNVSQEIRNKSGYMEYLVSMFPELTPIFNRQRKIKTGYYSRIFEAVGAARHCSDLQTNSETSS